MSRTEVRLADTALPSWEGVLPAWLGTEDDGVHVRCTPATGAEPALLVHGLGGASTNWTDLMGLLAGHVDGSALDLPGFGRSARPSAHTLGAHARRSRRSGGRRRLRRWSVGGGCRTAPTRSPGR